MTDDEERRGRRWPWLLLILAAVLCATLVLGTWRGECRDAAQGSPAVSACVVEPVLGWPGTWAVIALCAVAVAWSIRSIRVSRRRATLPGPPG